MVTGATGSGKSTTLAAMVHHINKTRPVHVVTIEDPIEYLHLDDVARITQREIGADTASYQQALRHVVRQSPDVILIGEMRDVESIQVALAAALTGHLVLTTLHTIDAPQTLQRILNYFPEHLRAQVAMDLAQCLQGIVASDSCRVRTARGGSWRQRSCTARHLSHASYATSASMNFKISCGPRGTPVSSRSMRRCWASSRTKRSLMKSAWPTPRTPTSSL